MLMTMTDHTFPHLTVITHVAVQLVDVMRTLQQKRKSETMNWIVCSVSYSVERLYLAGVSGAGLWDVTVVDSVSTHHSSPLVLGHSDRDIR